MIRPAEGTTYSYAAMPDADVAPSGLLASSTRPAGITSIYT